MAVDGGPRSAFCSASPNLALVKYWGKNDRRRNLPATPSVGITLDGLRTATRVFPEECAGCADRVFMDGHEQPAGRYADFFAAVRETVGSSARFHVESRNDFPTGAGLASSASGFAALAAACTRAVRRDLPPEELSALARIGSASAARSVFPGFVLLPAGASAARQLHASDHWSNLRILVVTIRSGPKAVTSRDAMERARTTSPFYDAWVASSTELMDEAVAALEARDLERLGETMRASYLGMFSTMFTSRPPIIYWIPDTLRVLQLCETLRRQGLGAWETMDAGPQVKILCEAQDVEAVMRRIREKEAEAQAGGTAGWRVIVSRPGGAVACEEDAE